MRSRKTIIVSGMIAADPWQGGATWAVLQYVVGLKRLGHEVLLIEPLREKGLRPAGVRLGESKNAEYFREVATDFELGDRCALLLAGSRETYGLSYNEIQRWGRRADVLINISGMLADDALVGSIPVRVYLDLDPAFNQLWNTVQGIDMRFEGHTHFVTIGLALGEGKCTVPTCNRSWLKSLQPIVLERWPVATRVVQNALTTIGNWRGYGSIRHDGVMYGQKAHSLRQFFTLPALTEEKFLLAMAIHPNETKDLAALASHGWDLVDPAQVANTPASYQHFIQGSKAEFGIAKSGYVESRCAWFSDRSVCYLASGRPVLAQETGYSAYLPTGKGLFSFRGTDDVLSAVEELRGNYPKHARAARAIAEEYFDSDKVLRELLSKVGCE